jgi:hypothetical protein
MSSARPAQDENGDPAYSIFRQGAGLVNAYDAVYSTASGCANVGVDVDADLLGADHYFGRANRDDGGVYYIEEMDGQFWSGGFPWGAGLAWSDAAVAINEWVPQE